jgi:hypothetical protein
MNRFPALALILTLNTLLLAPETAAAQSMNAAAELDIAISRRVINDKRNQTLAFNMSFTQQEKEDFWPLYREYRDAMAKVGDKRLALIVDYADHYDNMSDAKARQLLDESMKIQRERLKLQQRYIRKFQRILSDIKVVRLFQIENRIDAAVELKLSEGIPLME